VISSRLLQIVLLFICFSSMLLAEPNNRLWYQQPAQQWEEALPVGNGRLGAMIYGGLAQDRIQYNEETLWTGAPQEYHNPTAHTYLDTIRQLLFDGEQKKATDVAMEKFMSQPLGQERYQPFADLIMSFPGHEKATDYYRDLNLETAVATTIYQVDGVTFTRKVFATAVDDIIVVQLFCDQPEKLDVTLGLECPHSEFKQRAEIGELHLKGQVSDYVHEREKQKRLSALKFASLISAEPDGGDMAVNGDKLEIKGATSVLIKITAATNYVNYRDISAYPPRLCIDKMNDVKGKSFDSLLAPHIKDHQIYFDRVDIDLGTGRAASLPTDVRLQKYTHKSDPGLAALYFQYGRYLLITSSRPGTRPANLQGIWNDQMEPPWDSKYTANINTEMNYWPAEVTNLSELTEPLFTMLQDVSETGAATARAHYNAPGWVLHHNTDIWRGTAPINHSNHGIWVTGGAWLATHLWEHYLYTLDKDFLAEQAYPLMRGLVLFFDSFLIKEPETDYLISTPSNSPEIGGLVAGPTMDHQIIRDLFDYFVQASKTLNEDVELRKSIREKRNRIAPSKIGRLGQLQEWMQDIDDPENKHRHVSHLYGLYPSHQITLEETPALFDAAKKSLEMRGDDGTGWSMAWKVNLWARLKDGDHALKMLGNLFSPAGTNQTQHRRGGSYPNLFDAHPPFQIDGNFGATAGIAEMLMQSHSGGIELLPALPSAWPSGKVSGLVARGAFEVDIKWKKGNLVQAKIKSQAGQKCVIRYSDKRINFDTVAGKEYILTKKDFK
jgi:alpha-L-fucosidase 2